MYIKKYYMTQNIKSVFGSNNINHKHEYVNMLSTSIFVCVCVPVTSRIYNHRFHCVCLYPLKCELTHCLCYIGGFDQASSRSIANALELLQCCAKPSIKHKRVFRGWGDGDEGIWNYLCCQLTHQWRFYGEWAHFINKLGVLIRAVCMPFLHIHLSIMYIICNMQCSTLHINAWRFRRYNKQTGISVWSLMCIDVVPQVIMVALIHSLYDDMF